MKKRWSLLSTLLILSLIISACSSSNATGDESEDQQDVKNVEVTTATQESLDSLSSLSGTLLPSEEVNLAFQLGGVIDSLNVEVGDVVEEGDILGNLADADYELQLQQADSSIDQALASLNSSDVAIEAANATVSSSAASIKSAQASLEAVKKGAREQEKTRAKLTMDNSEVAYENAKINADRMKTLYDAGLISKQEYENVQLSLSNAQTAYESAKAAYSLLTEGATDEQIKQAEAALASAKANQSQAKSSVSQANASKVQAQSVYDQALIGKTQAELTLEKAKLKSPISGVVLSKLVPKGNFVSAGTTILTIGNTNELKVLLPVADSEVHEWKVGDKVNISLYDDVQVGTVRTIYPLTNDGTGTVSVEVVISNSEGKWLPGQVVKANHVSQDNVGILIPIEAVINNGIESYVFKVVDGIAVKTVVETGDMVNNKIHITSGLESGEQVVVRGAALILDGDPLNTSGGSEE
nr:efflux RND transporter periplasmic adaptor subunit [Lysinibacillus timonensis]